MIQHVYEKSIQSQLANDVIVATDDPRIYSSVTAFGGKVVMTSKSHETGTDRVIEVAEKTDADIFINVQGDEPLIRPEDIDLLIEKMVNDPCSTIATLCHQIPIKEAVSPNVVKVVRAANGRALYFSRSLIPHVREDDVPVEYFKHVGIYGYQKHILREYKNLPYSPLEHVEKLEQLRLIEAGFSIDVLETNKVGIGVDTPEDLRVVRQLIHESFESVAVQSPNYLS